MRGEKHLIKKAHHVLVGLITKRNKVNEEEF